MKLDKFTYIFTEERDCGANTSLPEFNKLRVKTCSNGMANYLVISTDRWALDGDSLEELYSELKRLLLKST